LTADLLDFAGDPDTVPLIWDLGNDASGNEYLFQLAMISSAFDTSTSGIVAAATKLQANANNVANANTNGYQTQRVDLVESPAGVEARAASVDAPNRADAAANPNRNSQSPPSDVNLADEMVSMVANGNFYQANMRALQAADDMMGTLLDTNA
jgi:flagellar basal-body rod protein FlgC